MPHRGGHNDAIRRITVIPVEINDVEPRVQVNGEDRNALHRLHGGDEVIEGPPKVETSPPHFDTNLPE